MAHWNRGVEYDADLALPVFCQLGPAEASIYLYASLVPLTFDNAKYRAKKNELLLV